ncbi:hypothetical protein JVT61DRAFT_6689 [Boletus reticuloceps]|uniref:Uncharacterized protein n=1 Tax=Boletus reticuloceps TaxID=495285 RepID=A0A8I2YJ70_9AGAM|nr:hypothetical protein JVT61DRAFT_6689 [Boletus reticuloceps]
MRLNCALVSSFLFVSAALAGHHPEKQQPPFLNRVEKSIISTTVFPLRESAGVTWIAEPEEAIETAAGTFTVPSAEGDVGSFFVIMVGISTSDCNAITIGVGIIGQIFEDGVFYRGFAKGREMVLSPDPILAGNVIRASIEVESTTTAFVTLVNTDGGTPWSKLIYGDPQDTRCRQDVKWIITTRSGADTLPEFDTLVIKEMSVEVSKENEKTKIVPRRPNIITDNYVGHFRVETSIMFYRDHVIIIYIPPPPPS